MGSLSYVINNELTMSGYIESAIIDNLKGYVRDYRPSFDETQISNIIYTLLYSLLKQFYLFECKHEYKINVYNEN